MSKGVAAAKLAIRKHLTAADRRPLELLDALFPPQPYTEQDVKASLCQMINDGEIVMMPDRFMKLVKR